MMPIQCATCKHTKKGEVTCDAFPDGIPHDLFLGGVSHRKPYPGDNGIQWEPDEETKEEDDQ